MKNMLLLAIVAVSSGALAQGPTESSQAAQSKKKANGLVCRDVEETGSRLGGTRVCMTREQWEDTRSQARQAVGASGPNATANSGRVFARQCRLRLTSEPDVRSFQPQIERLAS